MNRRRPERFLPSALIAVWLSAFGQTGVAQKPDEQPAAIIDSKRLMRDRFDELVNALRDRDSRLWALPWLGYTEWSDANAEKAVVLLSDTLSNPDDTDRQIAAQALQSFARNNRGFVQRAVQPLIKAIGKAQGNELIEITDALGEIGPTARPAVEQLQPLLEEHHHAWIRIHAATSLCRIRPENTELLNVLIEFLSATEANLRWSAAIALSKIGLPAKAGSTQLRKLLKDDDPRVRVLSAGALWEIEHDADLVLPVLTCAMTEKSLPVFDRFIYPSYAGESHRVNAARILGDIGPKAKSAVPALVAAIREMAVDMTTVHWDVFVGHEAMSALGRIGPEARDALPAIREVRNVDQSVYFHYPQVVDEAIARIESTTSNRR